LRVACEVFVLTIMSAKERLTAGIGRWMRAIAAIFRRPAELKGIARARGQMGRNLDLSHPELYGIPSAGIVKESVRRRDACSEPAKAMQAYLPIGPSCC
jgi:hypothetical protein